MEKKNVGLVVLIILIVGALCGVGGYYIAKDMNNNSDLDKNTVPAPNGNSSNNNENEKISLDDIDDSVFDYKSHLSEMLYSYITGESTDFKTYLNNLSNSDKLWIGNVGENVKFSQIETNLTNIFGNNLNVKAEDFYFGKEDLACLVYNSNTKSYEYNPNYAGHGYESRSLYNYKIKEITQTDNQFSVTYYGLYAIVELPTEFTNNKNININKSDLENEDFDTAIKKYFDNNKNDFFQFKYTFTKTDNGYHLTNFKKVA